MRRYWKTPPKELSAEAQILLALVVEDGYLLFPSGLERARIGVDLPAQSSPLQPSGTPDSRRHIDNR